MADVTVTQFAEVLKVPVDKLLEQLDEAGISVEGADDTISEDAKMELLGYLRRQRGKSESKLAAAPRKITLKRKSQTELRMSGNKGS
ncbi:MAG: translation initiation factor IF-2 N-terminal domain-containing protein, partial [Pseudomonadota bacterium]